MKKTNSSIRGYIAGGKTGASASLRRYLTQSMGRDDMERLIIGFMIIWVVSVVTMFIVGFTIGADNERHKQ
jgi:hypothetical protein